MTNGGFKGEPRVGEDRSGPAVGHRVTVLLSTFNGEEFLREQLASLLEQDWRNCSILVRDDGSTDGTCEILREFEERFERVSVILGMNVGVAESFLSLVRSCGPSDYYAYCDQDDYWRPDKISRAVYWLSAKDESTPLLYGSALTPVDEDLHPIASASAGKIHRTFANALLENSIAGCTMVFNRAARDALCIDIPKGLSMHDWWTYLVVSALGEVIYDPESRILYRQHSSNTVGLSRTQLGRWWRRVRRVLALTYIPLAGQQARELERIYGPELPESTCMVLLRFVHGRGSLAARIQYALKGEAHRHSRLDDFIFRILIIINRI